MDSVTRMAIDGQQAFALIATVLWTMLRIGAVVNAVSRVIAAEAAAAS